MAQIKPKKKMQEVNFTSVEEFLEFLPEEEYLMVELLRETVLNCIPDCIEKLSYNVPYYKHHSNICFIWPPSIGWGKSKHVGVRFGFTRGNLLTDETGFLDKGSRKQVYWKDFKSIDEINIDLLKSLLFEAVVIDTELSKAKRK